VPKQNNSQSQQVFLKEAEHFLKEKSFFRNNKNTNLNKEKIRRQEKFPFELRNSVMLNHKSLQKLA